MKTLLVADVHLGKEHVLGRAGVSIPGGVSEDTLTHLFALVEHFGAERLLVLGDFVHGYHTIDESWVSHLSALRQTHAELSIQVVAGNHDKQPSMDLLQHHAEWINDTLHEAPFVFTHEPHGDDRGYVLCGHLHPAYRVQSTRKQRLRAPAFWFQRNVGILPAFGHFTGGKEVIPEAWDRIYITGPDCVIEV